MVVRGIHQGLLKVVFCGYAHSYAPQVLPGTINRGVPTRCSGCSGCSGCSVLYLLERLFTMCQECLEGQKHRFLFLCFAKNDVPLAVTKSMVPGLALAYRSEVCRYLA